MKRKLRWFRKACEGTAAIEFAIVVPVLALTILGIIECGRAYFAYSNLRYAVDQAGRYAMVYTSASDTVITQRVTQELVAMNSNLVTVTIQAQAVGGKNYKKISASYSFSTVVGGILGLTNVPIATDTTVPVLP